MRVHRGFLIGATIVGGAIAVTAATLDRPVLSHHTATATRPVPAPTFHEFASASRAEVLAYAKSLEFDTSYHAIDRRRLMYKTSTGLKEGPVAIVAPEVGVTEMKLREMYEGRIIARVTTDGAFPAQGFAKGDNYVWVDKINGKLRSVIVPADPRAPTREFGFTVQHENINAPGSGPEAKFRWSAVSPCELIWVRCEDGCCLVEPMACTTLDQKGGQK